MVGGVPVPDEQDQTAAARPRKRAGESTSRQTPRDGRAKDEPVDFQAAAARLTARAAQISKLKAEVDAGSYHADADETARAMERRSDA